MPASLQQLHEVGQRRQRDPRLTVDRRPAHVGDRRRLALHEDRDAQPAGDRLHRPDERADRLDVVTDVGDQRDVGLESLEGDPVSRRPARLDDLDIGHTVLDLELHQRIEHARRRVERDHASATRSERHGDRQRVPPGAGTDVDPRLARSDESPKDVEDRFIGAPWVGSEEARDRGIEVRAVRDLAEALDLLGVGDDASCPGVLEEADEIGPRVDIGIATLDADRDLLDQLRMRLEERAEPAVATRLVDQPERRTSDEDRVPPGTVAVHRDDDGPVG